MGSRSLTREGTQLPAVGVWSLSHWKLPKKSPGQRSLTPHSWHPPHPLWGDLASQTLFSFFLSLHFLLPFLLSDSLTQPFLSMATLSQTTTLTFSLYHWTVLENLHLAHSVQWWTSQPFTLKSYHSYQPALNLPPETADHSTVCGSLTYQNIIRTFTHVGKTSRYPAFTVFQSTSLTISSKRGIKVI